MEAFAGYSLKVTCGTGPIVALAGAALLAACAQEAPEVAACEGFLKEDLSSPSTYRRAGVKSYDVDWSSLDAADREGLQDRRRTGLIGVRQIFIDYDVANTFGTPVRELGMCQFPIYQHAPGEVRNPEGSANLGRAKRSLQRTRVSVGQAAPDEQPYICCL